MNWRKDKQGSRKGSYVYNRDIQADTGQHRGRSGLSMRRAKRGGGTRRKARSVMTIPPELYTAIAALVVAVIYRIHHRGEEQ